MGEVTDDAARPAGTDPLPKAELERRVAMIGRILESFGLCDDGQVISSSTSLWEDETSGGSVQLDSVDTFEILLTLEEECGLVVQDLALLDHIHTVGDLALALETIA